MKSHSLITRTLSGAIYVLLLVGCTLYNPIRAFFFFAIIAAATLWEFSTIMNEHVHITMPRLINSLAGFVLVSAVWNSTTASPQTARVFALYGLLLIFILVSELYRHAKTPLRNWTFCFASQIYVALPFALLSLLYINFGEGPAVMDPSNKYFLLALFIFLWVNDTFAYLFGISLRKVFPVKLFPRISPKKSWIGSIGGGVCTIVAAFLVCCYWVPGLMSLERWIGFAIVVIFFGTWGDLVESLIKRQLGIKDSGKVLPGHGGLLDRFDSALLAIPASVIYFILT